MQHATAHTIVPLNVPHSRSHEGRFGRLFGRGFTVWQPPGAGDPEKGNGLLLLLLLRAHRRHDLVLSGITSTC